MKSWMACRLKVAQKGSIDLDWPLELQNNMFRNEESF
jgi:hypothetical protein